MVLAIVIAFVVLKILHDFVSTQTSLFANNCWGKQNYEKDSFWLDLSFYWTLKNTQHFLENKSSTQDKQNIFIEIEAA